MFSVLFVTSCSDEAATGGTVARTLDNCGGSAAADVPAFFSKYFRCADITVSGTNVVISTQALPPYKSPYYNEAGPNWIAFDTRSGTRQQNPNVILAQSLTMKIPITPVSKGLTIGTSLVDRSAGTSADEYHGDLPGMSLEGVPMFHGVAAPGDDIAEEEKTFDAYEGHPQMSGVYHHHASSPGPLEVLKAAGLVTQTTPGMAEIELYGIMCDGTVVLGCTELDGTAASETGLDAQNGHVTDLKDEAGTVHFAQRYHTHVCRAKFTKHLYAPEIQYYTSCPK